MKIVFLVNKLSRHSQRTLTHSHSHTLRHTHIHSHT